MKLTIEKRLEMYRLMVKIRYFEEAVKQEEIIGHLCIGQEATHVGACMALKKTDLITAYHRSHGHSIAKGAPLKQLMAELMGKITGCCKGRGGTLHLIDKAAGILATSAIVGGGIPLALGAGLSIDNRGTNQVSVCFFGDGASNQGTFHESINMAALWKLPVIFFCDNNRYSMSTSLKNAAGQTDVALHARGYNIPGIIVDGQDVEAVFKATSDAVNRARKGHGPTLIEAKTYRFEEHSMGMDVPTPYRSQDEIKYYTRSCDPIELYKTFLLSRFTDDKNLSKIEKEERNAVFEAVKFGKESNYPPLNSVSKYMYSDPIDEIFYSRKQ